MLGRNTFQFDPSCVKQKGTMLAGLFPTRSPDPPQTGHASGPPTPPKPPPQTRRNQWARVGNDSQLEAWPLLFPHPVLPARVWRQVAGSERNRSIQSYSNGSPYTLLPPPSPPPPAPSPSSGLSSGCHYSFSGGVARLPSRRASVRLRSRRGYLWWDSLSGRRGVGLRGCRWMRSRWRPSGGRTSVGQG